MSDHPTFSQQLIALKGKTFLFGWFFTWLSFYFFYNNRNAPGDLRVRLGEWDVNRESEFYPHVEKDVYSVLIHPEYYPGNLYNDVALVRFDGAVDFAYK